MASKIPVIIGLPTDCENRWPNERVTMTLETSGPPVVSFCHTRGPCDGVPHLAAYLRKKCSKWQFKSSGFCRDNSCKSCRDSIS
jgi:hypothetical protein